ncbi:hypothetical protein VPDG_00082 [Vibrio phage henriette 12B8]|uniref:hypothetical protein n=1 Tax=Vibrio phage henriette 12B8 TaxID=573174 RepID=UPI0002C058FF|nr:hypothetical protein VPDG_00082 [Vibrio phage henriette 12B8]AGG58243.1 hypothetical protein VPDG_00082 [Vibrio phage henriette 12B8]
MPHDNNIPPMPHDNNIPPRPKHRPVPQPNGLGVACSRCGEEWGTCEHSRDTTPEQDELYDNGTMMFCIGAIVGALCMYFAGA